MKLSTMKPVAPCSRLDVCRARIPRPARSMIACLTLAFLFPSFGHADDLQVGAGFTKITPPTAQNYPRMEADLWKLAPEVISRPHEEASLACEHLIRSYDPCISCSTHFLKLKVERV